MSGTVGMSGLSSAPLTISTAVREKNKRKPSMDWGSDSEYVPEEQQGSDSDWEDSELHVEDTLSNISEAETAARFQNPTEGQGVRPGNYECKKCGKMFPKSSKLERHMRTHDKKRPYPCPHKGCTKAFSRKDHLARHVILHTGETPYHCPRPGCGMKFSSKAKLRRHTVSHDRPLPYTCGFEGCMEKFGKKTQLRRHQETHEGMLPYVCRETAASGQACGEAFRTPNDLRRHKVHVHGKRRHVCGVDGCAMRFIRFAELTGHRREAHPELSIVQCPECAQIFRDRDALRKHRVSHQKKYVCGEQGCGKAFSTSYNLKTHVNMVHLRIKPFKCDVSGCAKTFSTKGSLKRHKSKIHTPKAPEELKAQEGQRRAKKRARLLDKICGKDITRSEDEVKVTQVQQQQIRKKARLLDEICRSGNSR